MVETALGWVLSLFAFVLNPIPAVGVINLLEYFNEAITWASPVIYTLHDIIFVGNGPLFGGGSAWIFLGAHVGSIVIVNNMNFIIRCAKFVWNMLPLT